MNSNYTKQTKKSPCADIIIVFYIITTYRNKGNNIDSIFGTDICTLLEDQQRNT